MAQNLVITSSFAKWKLIWISRPQNHLTMLGVLTICLENSFNCERSAANALAARNEVLRPHRAFAAGSHWVRLHSSINEWPLAISLFGPGRRVPKATLVVVVVLLVVVISSPGSKNP